jgi:hypothetical protein
VNTYLPPAYWGKTAGASGSSFAINGCPDDKDLPENAEELAYLALCELTLKERLKMSKTEVLIASRKQEKKAAEWARDKEILKRATMWALLPTIAAAATIAYKPSVIGPLFSIKAGSALLGGYLAFTIIISRLINTDNALEYKAANAGTNVDVYLNTDLVQDTLEKFQKQKQDQLIERR